MCELDLLRVARQAREANIRSALVRQGLIRVDGWEPHAARWCTGSLSFPDADPAQDAFGDCVECNEPLIWVVRLEEAAHG